MSLPPLPPSLDQVCDRFEAAWRGVPGGGPRPRAEDFLLAAPEGHRQALLLELLAVEVGCRKRMGETPQAEEYRRRFRVLPAAWLARELATSPGRPSANASGPETPRPEPGTLARPTGGRIGRGWWLALALAAVLLGGGGAGWALLGRRRGNADPTDAPAAAAAAPAATLAFAAGPLRGDFPLKASLLGGTPDPQGVVRLREGQGVQVRVEVDRDAQVYLWTVSAEGVAVQLFPHDGERDARCKAGVARTLPGQDFELAARPGGREQLRVVASTQPLPPLPGQKQGGFLVFADPRQQQALGTALRDLFVRPVVRVAEAAIPYQVDPER